MKILSQESLNLETERCYLKPVVKEDASDIRELYLDPSVRQYLGGVIEENDFPEKFKQIMSNSSPYQWVARLKDTHAFTGLFTLDSYHDTQEIELSYQVSKAMQGQGLAYEICKRMIDFGFSNVGLTKIVSETQSANLQSIKLLEKLGMTCVQTLERYGNIQVVYHIIKAG
jgi:ribosomal-protein-alanine N-acetyltransferase